ncbi:sex peptide receptor-related protein 2-like [Planococcus citri]|uniref:sex peptide receptor-related protein 2-like n=1 Tax=Planococcus citri TaxID=170843 RepID=UPI0031F98F72
MTSNPSFCESMDYYNNYIRGYVNIPICFIGVIFNLFNILVFTRKNMISSANLIFTNLAIADLLTLLSSIPSLWIGFFQYYIALVQGDYENWTHTRAVIYLYSIDFVEIFTKISVFLTVMLAIWRHIAIAHPLKERYWCSMKTTRNTVIAIYVISVLFSIPLYFSYRILSINGTDMYYLPLEVENSILLDISFAITTVLKQILPSVVLPIFSFKLIVALLTNQRNKEKTISSSNTRNKTRNLKMKQQVNRSIIITLTVLVLFLIIRLPAGLYKLIDPIPGVHNELPFFVHKCFERVRFIVETLNVINMSITFMVYYIMSQNFRATFKSLLFKSDGFSPRKMNLLPLGNTRKIDTIPETDQVY